jgi:hypothetical protein
MENNKGRAALGRSQLEPHAFEPGQIGPEVVTIKPPLPDASDMVNRARSCGRQRSVWPQAPSSGWLWGSRDSAPRKGPKCPPANEASD